MPQQMRNGLDRAAVDIEIYMLLRNGSENTDLAQGQNPRHHAHRHFRHATATPQASFALKASAEHT